MGFYNGRYRNLRLSEVKYGFGWKFNDDPSTQTIGNVLDILDSNMAKLQKQNSELAELLRDACEIFDEEEYTLTSLEFNGRLQNILKGGSDED